MEAHFLQLDTSSVKRLLVRRDEESVKVDQVFVTRKEMMKKDVTFYCFFLWDDDNDDDDLHSLLV